MNKQLMVKLLIALNSAIKAKYNIAFDEFKESNVERDEDGKFTSGGGGGSTNKVDISQMQKTSGNEKYAKWVNDLLMSKNPHDRSVGEYHKRQIDAIGKSR